MHNPIMRYMVRWYDRNMYRPIPLDAALLPDFPPEHFIDTVPWISVREAMCLSQLADGDTIVGRWSVSIAGAPSTGGRYRLACVGSRADVELDVTEHWRPQNLPLGMTILTRLMPMFRTWPASSRWRRTVDLGVEPTLSGAWERRGNA